MSDDKKKLEQNFFERTGRKMSSLMKAFLTSSERVEIKSLEGAPSSIGGLHAPQITSLDGAPASVGGDLSKVSVLTSINAPAESLEMLKKFEHPSNALKYLEGSPVVPTEINLPTGLKSLEGVPVPYAAEIKLPAGLKSLEGAPSSIGGLHTPQLTSLDGVPASVFNVLPPQGKITSLDGVPASVFDVLPPQGKITSLDGAPSSTSLKGAPKPK